VDGDVAVAIHGPQGREGDAVAEDLFRRESADRLGSSEFSLDIIYQSVRVESRHPGIDIVVVAGGKVPSDRWRQVVGYIAGHGWLHRIWGETGRLRGHPGREPDLKGLSSGPHFSEAKVSIPSKRH
jgi:hypothetical protein